MVHALREAHRVLKPDGLLLDLRPGPVHRRVGIEVYGHYEQLAIMGEKRQACSDVYLKSNSIAIAQWL